MPDQRARVTAEVRGDGLHVAALALGGARREGEGVPHPRVDVDRDAHLVTQQRQRRVAQREGGVERESGGDALLGSTVESEQALDTGVEGGGGLGGAGELVPVGVPTSHERIVNHCT